MQFSHVCFAFFIFFHLLCFSSCFAVMVSFIAFGSLNHNSSVAVFDCVAPAEAKGRSYSIFYVPSVAHLLRF
jgi:hypothetical protein